ncbi:MAG: cell division protein FtsA [Anaerolineales bacterium]|nr:cell division protein FtsA [Anaerolineales bacterium]
MAVRLGTEEHYFVGLDVGTSKLCLLVGQLTADQDLQIIASGVVPSAGMRKGGVVSLESLTQALKAVRDKAERSLGYEISSALVNLSGAQISSLNSKGMAGVTGRTIGRDDISRALDAARSIVIPYNREVIHAIPRGYIVDDQDGIRNAIGMHGYRMEVEAHIVTASSTSLQNLEQCIERAGLFVDGWVLSSLAAAEMVLTETEREMGVVVCDIGAGTTDLAIYIEGAVWHTAVIPIGGQHLTNDIAQVLHLPEETSEMIKRRHGQARAETCNENQAFAVRPFGDGKPFQIKRKELASIIEPRVEEIFGFVRQEIKRSGYDGLLPAGLVLTGGTSELPGIRDVAAKVLRLPVRLGKPEHIRGVADEISAPHFSTSLGLLHWAELMQTEGASLNGSGKGVLSFDMDRMVDFFRRLLPG